MSWFNAESAKNRIAASFEVAGGALTDLASSHVAAARQQQQQQNEQRSTTTTTGSTPGTSTTDSSSSEMTSLTGASTTGGATVVKLPPKKGTNDGQASASNSQSMMKTANTLPVAVRSSDVAQANGGTSNKNPQQQQQRKNQFSSFFMKNSDKFLANTQRMLERTANVVQTQTQNLQLSLNQQRSATGIRIRDPSLPLDTDALRDAEVVYITDRIITLGHPAMQSQIDPDITAARKLAAVGQLMNKRHFGKYMVWNLSEVEYDYSLLNEQVLAYKFPGSPSPPLGLLLKLIFSMESWLKADPKNVAVLHCLTGKGRTSTVLACFLCWTGEAGFHDPLRALEYIALCKRQDVDQLTIPSQRRYVTYFSNMLDGVRPHHPPLILKRVILSDAAKYERAPGTATASATGEGKRDDESVEMGCSPYIQLFKAGNLILTAAPTLKAPPPTASSSTGTSDNADGDGDNKGSTGTELPFCRSSDGSITFLVETIIQGDILIRCRHLSQKGQRVSMFRAAFHTGYTPPKVMRLGKLQLDGACTDRRFADDFFVDLVFEACDVTEASKHLLRSQSSSLNNNSNQNDAAEVASATKAKLIAAEAENSLNEAAARRARGAIETSDVAKSQATGNVGVSATTYDTMLHRDGRFWDAIAKRRQENMKRQEEQQQSDAEGGAAGSGNRSGPTIGRRRNSKTMKKRSAASRQNSAGGGTNAAGVSTSGATTTMPDGSTAGEMGGGDNLQSSMGGMDAFTIGGGDFDFGADFGDSTTASTPVVASAAPAPPAPPKKDDLMDALMALDDEDEDEEVDITFSNDDEDISSNSNNNEESTATSSPKEDQTVKAAVQDSTGPSKSTTTGPTSISNNTVAESPVTSIKAQEVATVNEESSVAKKEDLAATAPMKAEQADTNPSTEQPIEATTTTDIAKNMEQLEVKESVPENTSSSVEMKAPEKKTETSPASESVPAAMATSPTAPVTAPTPAPAPAPVVEDKTKDDDTDLGLDDLDNEIVALMAGGDDDDDDVDIDLDDDDQDLEDLEAFLTG